MYVYKYIRTYTYVHIRRTVTNYILALDLVAATAKESHDIFHDKIDLASGYDIASSPFVKIHHAIKNGKPSISIRAIEKPWLC